MRAPGGSGHHREGVVTYVWQPLAHQFIVASCRRLCIHGRVAWSCKWTCWALALPQSTPRCRNPCKWCITGSLMVWMSSNAWLVSLRYVLFGFLSRVWRETLKHVCVCCRRWVRWSRHIPTPCRSSSRALCINYTLISSPNFLAVILLRR